MVKYVYDAWGNHAVLDDAGNDITENAVHIGNLNPFRYRGYFYDVETELYYLQTRYYDPEVGRFITIDGIEYLDPESINGLNLYAYCGDNPVMFTDPNGTFFLSLLIGALIAGAIVGTIKAVSTAVNGGSTKQIIGSFFSGFVMGGAMGLCLGLGGLAAAGIMGVSMALTGSLLIGACAGLSSYAIESAAYEQPMTWKGGVSALFSGMFQAAGTFAIGYFGGASGAFGNLAKRGTQAYNSAFAKGLVGTKSIYSTFSLTSKWIKGFIKGHAAGLIDWFVKMGVTSIPAAVYRAIMKRLFNN